MLGSHLWWFFILTKYTGHKSAYRCRFLGFTSKLIVSAGMVSRSWSVSNPRCLLSAPFTSMLLQQWPLGFLLWDLMPAWPLFNSIKSLNKWGMEIKSGPLKAHTVSAVGLIQQFVQLWRGCTCLCLACHLSICDLLWAGGISTLIPHGCLVS